MLTAITSALSGNVVKSHLAMTGEITLRGKVLPVGGIKRNSCCKRAGITHILLCEDNKETRRANTQRLYQGDCISNTLKQ